MFPASVTIWVTLLRPWPFRRCWSRV